MTKKQMIATIQLQEARAWLKLKEIETEYGAHDSLTKTFRSKYAAVYDLMDSLGIRSDFNLPEAEQAASLAWQQLQTAYARECRFDNV